MKLHTLRDEILEDLFPFSSVGYLASGSVQGVLCRTLNLQIFSRSRILRFLDILRSISKDVIELSYPGVHRLLELLHSFRYNRRRRWERKIRRGESEFPPALPSSLALSSAILDV